MIEDRRRVRAVIIRCSALVLALALAAPARADKVVDLSRALTTDPDFKVRVTAAVVLSKLRDRRSEPALIAGLDDKNETVRGMAAAALGNLGDPAAIAPLERVQTDRSDFVRARAREALAMLRPRDAMAGIQLGAALPSPRKRTVVLALGALHDNSRRATPAMLQRLRETLVKQIGDAPAFSLGTVEQATYVVDATI